MFNGSVYKEVGRICSPAGGQVLADELLSKHSFAGICGKAGIWCVPAGEESLTELFSYLKKNDIKIKIIGNGSNILMPDEPKDQIFINLSGKEFSKISFSENKVTCGAGVKLNSLIAQCSKEGYSGFEGLVGIPASVGGAIRMNASYKKCISDPLKSVKILRDGKIQTLEKGKIDFSYRYCSLRNDDVILEAVFAVKKADSLAVKKLTSEYFAEKLDKQPLDKKSLGCVFKNSMDFEIKSAAMIDQSGLKGLKVGDAMVSEKHANFIINIGKATSRDFLSLMYKVQEGVRKKFGVLIEPEVEILE